MKSILNWIMVTDAETLITYYIIIFVLSVAFLSPLLDLIEKLIGAIRKIL
ncbi:MAG: hypothetical protein G01um101433_619 [Parcubacteria group bacterium Gr01-1014_33]|nr:MAG: hypothetical protein G01um101433_619 [Parcubacteria group bacterium Gr01-1014_33]